MAEKNEFSEQDLNAGINENKKSKKRNPYKKGGHNRVNKK